MLLSLLLSRVSFFVRKFVLFFLNFTRCFFSERFFYYSVDVDIVACTRNTNILTLTEPEIVPLRFFFCYCIDHDACPSHTLMSWCASMFLFRSLSICIYMHNSMLISVLVCANISYRADRNVCIFCRCVCVFFFLFIILYFPVIIDVSTMKFYR